MQRKIRKIAPLMAKAPVKKRVAAYARVSSGKDAMIHSLSSQISYYSEYIQKHAGWEYVGVYADEAVTGTKDGREEFQRLLADCRNGRIDMVITKSISRFARNTVTMLEVVRELKSLEIDVFFEKENFLSENLSQKSGITQNTPRYAAITSETRGVFSLPKRAGV